jgi:hypothetical protein
LRGQSVGQEANGPAPHADPCASAAKATPHPPLAKDGHEDGDGGSKSSRSPNSQTGGGHENECKHHFRDPDAPRAPARGRLT